jgi:inner membrane protein
MSENNNEKGLFEKIGMWTRNSISLKLISITILTLLLLIPISMVKSLISERQLAKQFATEQVSRLWADNQTISGPILTIPYTVEKKSKEDKIYTIDRQAHFLPNNLDINGNVTPEILERGIYEIVVYKSKLDINATFSDFNMPSDAVNIDWKNAYITFGITDLKGIRDDLNVLIDGKKINSEPGTKIHQIISSGITSPIETINNETKKIAFSLNLDFQGSQHLNFIPLGKVTNVNIESTWNSPSFTGNFSPKEREVSDKGFSSHWKVLYLNRNYPQSWIDNQYTAIERSEFGVNLMLSLDDYQRSTRSIKYSLMTIVLVFLVFFLTEIVNNKKIHAFQYTLVGLTIVIFYTLLVSLSEHLDFNPSYLIASAITILMIGLYSISIFKKKSLTIILIISLSSVLLFVFVTLQLKEYALIIGTIGLTIILGITMYLTKNIKWLKQ